MGYIAIVSSGIIPIDDREIPFDLDQNTAVQMTPFIESDTVFLDGALFIDTAEPLKIGKKYSITVTKDKFSYSFKVAVRQPCLIYLGNVTIEPEIWRVCDQESIPLTQNRRRCAGF